MPRVLKPLCLTHLFYARSGAAAGHSRKRPGGREGRETQWIDIDWSLAKCFKNKQDYTRKRATSGTKRSFKSEGEPATASSGYLSSYKVWISLVPFANVYLVKDALIHIRLPPDNAISTINAARHQRLTEEFVPFLAIYYYLSQFIDCPSSDSSIAATVMQCHDWRVLRRKYFSKRWLYSSGYSVIWLPLHWFFCGWRLLYFAGGGCWHTQKQGFRVKEGLGCMLSHATTALKSTQFSPSLTRKPCTHAPRRTDVRCHSSD